MSLHKVNLIYEGYDLQVDFYFYPGYGGSYYEPPESDTVEIQDIYLMVENKTISIITLMSDEMITNLEEQILKTNFSEEDFT